MILSGLLRPPRAVAFVLLLALCAPGWVRAQEAPCDTVRSFERLFAAYVGLYESEGSTLPRVQVRARRHELGRVDRADLIWALRDTSLADRTAPLLRFLAEAKYLAALIDREDGLARNRLDRPDSGAVLIAVEQVLARFDCRAELADRADSLVGREGSPAGGPDRLLWLGAVALAVAVALGLVGLRALRQREKRLTRRYGLALETSILAQSGTRPALLSEISRRRAWVRLADTTGLEVGHIVQIGLAGDWHAARTLSLEGDTAQLDFRRPVTTPELDRIVALGRRPRAPASSAA